MESIKFKEKQFNIIKLLGKGKGGYSYLVADGENEYVLKQIHHEPCSYYNFGDKMQAELCDYNKLKKLNIKMPEMFDYDIENEQILKQYIKGPSAYDLVLEDKMKQEYIDQICNMCNILYQSMLNIDYFPTNFILCNETLWYIDYECNDYMEEWNFENWGIKYWSKTEEFCKYAEEHK